MRNGEIPHQPTVGCREFVLRRQVTPIEWLRLNKSANRAQTMNESPISKTDEHPRDRRRESCPNVAHVPKHPDPTHAAQNSPSVSTTAIVCVTVGGIRERNENTSFRPRLPRSVLRWALFFGLACYSFQIRASESDLRVQVDVGSVRAIQNDKKGTIWIAGAKGLFRIDSDAAEPV